MARELNTATGQSGLTITAELFQAGLPVGSPISCPEISTGFYSGNMAGAAGVYSVVFFSSGVQLPGGGVIAWDGTNEVTTASLATLSQLAADLTVLAGDITNATATITTSDFNTLQKASITAAATAATPAVTVNSSAIVTAILAGISGQTINIVSPLVVQAGGIPVITVVAGDDYFLIDGRAITLPISGTFPDWTGATAVIEFGSLTVPANITVRTGTTRSAYFELPNVDTTLLAATTDADSGYAVLFDLVVTLATGSRTTVINQGVLTLLPNV